MPSKKETQIELMDLLIEKNSEGKMDWVVKPDEESIQASVGKFSFHIDRKTLSSKVNYKIWIFDDKGDDLDNFNTSVFDENPKNKSFNSYNSAIGNIYRNCLDGFTVKRILPAIDELKAQ